LYGHYVQGIKTDELVEELAISVRQLRREHKHALNALTDLLWDQYSLRFTPQAEQAVPTYSGEETRRDAAMAEAEQLIAKAQAETLELPALLQSLLDVLAPIAANHTTVIRNQLPDRLSPIYGGRSVLRQGL